MPRKQNPTAKGDRVLWNSLAGGSTETLTLSAYRAQYLIGIRPELATMAAALAFGGGAYHG
ncbi:hypothetical protein [Novosphingobium sp. EMRT-2]|uniref:hypothetical protein n=1 Tax=Novosphingobium sp. EMRT-2 TaxID=2571749 RepID=UPI0010BD1901|nr:hypothetical protein [Novosphingobium sp. EMRT-2]QCI92117.1 hypothetical protein FA702_00055 [Novosphingobium sp. EMRT-2]QCI95155.1 hypothetical protein FA702_17680 [Novosphingobium sp. EMRT-2]